MSSSDELTQEDWRLVRETVASNFGESVDSMERSRAEFLLRAGLVDVEAVLAAISGNGGFPARGGHY